MSAGKLRSMGETAMIERKYDLAVDYYRRAIKIEPENADNHFKLFRVHQRMKKLVDALSDLTKALELKNENVTYRKTRSKLLVSLGQCDRAVEDFRMLRELAANVDTDEEIKARQCSNEIDEGNRAYAGGDYVRAAHFFTAALAHTEFAPDLIFLRATSTFRTGDFYSVVSDTGSILKSHPNHLEAFELRGQAYTQLGEFEIAFTHYRQALKFDPEHKGCKAAHKYLKSITKSDKRGEDSVMKDELEEAISHWRKAISIAQNITPYIRETTKKIVKAYSRLQKHDEAIKEANMLIQMEESIEHFLVLGDAELDAELYQESVNTFRKAFDMAENDEDKRMAKEKYNKAETALKQSKEKNYYKILGVSRTATLKEIKKAYREGALKWHPDKNTDNTEEAETMFQDISEAYEVLSNEENRAKYDRGEDVFDNQGGGGGQHMNPHQFFRQNFQQGGGGGGGGQHFRFRHG
eukprot:CAMPEP_0194356262 /NCGR_PEP_ID=MMETSP0174-20130528/3969_1 /TAXON_ID=216777 /ORGANISM="Proboscia alata, Strain PI-D3" /LENGTH=465 /DNA_ID=CAMNT_0039125797 /DNA_START=224 /DNA_END=1621 /DNA_ORIENTATION=-